MLEGLCVPVAKYPLGDIMIKNRLKQIRHEMYIDTQQEMANLLGIRFEQYNRYENNKRQPSLDIALLIASRLNKHVDEIFYICLDRQ